MPNSQPHRTRPLAVLALIVALGSAAYAANVSTQSRPDFQRLLFDFGAPTRMQVGQGGHAVTLTFSNPVQGDVAAVAARMAPHVASAGLSADRRTVTLQLSQPYRVRQFISGDMVGVDILTGSVAAQPAPPPAPKPAPPAPKPAPVAAPKPAAIRDDPSPVLTTKRPVAPPAPEPRIEKEEEPAAPAPLLTTKEPHAIAPLTTKAPEPEPAAPAEEIEPEQAAAENALPPENPDRPFLITTKSTSRGTEIHFPWGERTGAAVFERARDIWIVFSRERDAQPQLLASVLPKQVVRVQQYRLPGATVLRLSTDGSLHASTSQPPGDYAWHVTLGTAQPAAALDIPVNAETKEGRRQLLLQAFDTAPALSFYDPTLGDRLLVVPTFEAGRGIGTRKQFPELDILPTQQGVAIASRRDDLSLRHDRSGLTLRGDSSLAISPHLPIFSADARPVPGSSSAANVLMPYDQWYVGAADFTREREARVRALSTATPSHAADSAMRMVQLYLGQGMAVEALGYLTLLRADHPDYFAERKLGVPLAASYVMLGRIPEAQEAIALPELEGVEEAAMWRGLVDIFTPKRKSAVEKLQADTEAETAARQRAAADAAVEETGEVPPGPAQAPMLPVKPALFDFLRYNDQFIRYYPPRIRQRLAVIAADAYSRNGQEEDALKTYDTLNRDGILGPVQPYAGFTLASIAAKKGQVKAALQAYDRLGGDYHSPYIQTQARYAAAMLRYAKGMETADRTAEILEGLRMAWRGDALQRDILFTLAGLYHDNKRYDDTLRTWKYLLDTFPDDPDTLTIAGDMAQLFQQLFLEGLADDMPPLKSLALFYEFRELTPIGAKGNDIIQKLADRLARVDLLDRATQLLESQIKFRLSGEDRARVGARLALLYLLNRQPAEALAALETTNYGNADRELRRQRIQLTAQSLSALGKHEDALGMLFHDDSREADLLRLDVLWAMKDWPNVINQAEDILSDRANLTAALTARETEVLLKLALGYSFEGDGVQLRYLRDYYSGLLPEGPYKDIFSFMTNDTAPLDTEDFELLTQQISRTESFLDTFRRQIAGDGGLSNTVK